MKDDTSRNPHLSLTDFSFIFFFFLRQFFKSIEVSQATPIITAYILTDITKIRLTIITPCGNVVRQEKGKYIDIVFYIEEKISVTFKGIERGKSTVIFQPRNKIDWIFTACRRIVGVAKLMFFIRNLLFDWICDWNFPKYLESLESGRKTTKALKRIDLEQWKMQ